MPMLDSLVNQDFLKYIFLMPVYNNKAFVLFPRLIGWLRPFKSTHWSVNQRQNGNPGRLALAWYSYETKGYFSSLLSKTDEEMKGFLVTKSCELSAKTDHLQVIWWIDWIAHCQWHSYQPDRREDWTDAGPTKAAGNISHLGLHNQFEHIAFSVACLNASHVF